MSNLFLAAAERILREHPAVKEVVSSSLMGFAIVAMADGSRSRILPVERDGSVKLSELMPILRPRPTDASEGVEP